MRYSSDSLKSRDKHEIDEVNINASFREDKRK